MFDTFDKFNTAVHIPLYEMSPLLGSSGRTSLLWNISAADSHSVLACCGAKGGNHPLTLDFLGVCLVFTILITLCIRNPERVNSVTFLAFLKVYDALLRKTLEKAWNTAALSLIILDKICNHNVLEKRICSRWAGGGLTPREAARGGFSTGLFPKHG